jgi:hypothetical protein
VVAPADDDDDVDGDDDDVCAAGCWSVVGAAGVGCDACDTWPRLSGMRVASSKNSAR